jgi:hypothetical protein
MPPGGMNESTCAARGRGNAVLVFASLNSAVLSQFDKPPDSDCLPELTASTETGSNKCPVYGQWYSASPYLGTGMRGGWISFLEFSRISIGGRKARSAGESGTTKGCQIVALVSSADGDLLSPACVANGLWIGAVGKYCAPVADEYPASCK